MARMPRPNSRITLRLLSGIVSLLTLAMVISIGPAQAAPTTTKPSRMTVSSSKTWSTVFEFKGDQAGIRSGSKLMRSPSGGISLVAPSGAIVAEGLTCRGFLDCGYQFSSFQTKLIITAASAGGVAAAVAACNAIPPVSELVCAVLGAVGGSLILNLVVRYTEGKCLYVSVTRVNLTLVDC